MNAAELWKKVVARDPASDGAFVYAVRTTRIYCRPSCASRRPLRANVEFFGSSDDAERAGFRACRRCGGRRDGAWSAQELVTRACRRLDASLEGERPTLDRLAEECGVGPHRLHRAFRSVLGISPRDYLAAKRAGRLKALLRDDASVASALYGAGYGSSSRLYERSDDELGMTPAVYRHGGQGMDIHYTVVRSALGWLLVGATDKGVCSVKLGDTAKGLEEDLKREYPKASIERDLGKESPAVTSLVEFIAGKAAPPKLPIDVEGTAFQRRVWKALQRIPFGATRSYGDVAKSVGQPKAARAVALACASNHVALIVPCHRVVQGNGALGGYHWGVARKKKLVALEQAMKGKSSRA
jgi:AraC family transcriptional regulator, regulatory protein of adaptative response / methylated-DNA-[protein]-cysteine methyltransferase